MPVAASIGAAGSLASAGLGVYGSLSASKAQTSLGQQALAQQEQMFQIAQGALNPFIQAGQGVLPTLKSLLTPGPSQTATLESLPGFQFQSQYGNLAATNALAARGLGGSSGPLATAISNYNQGLAGTSFSNLAGLLQNYANMGSGAAGSLAGTATQTGQNIAGTLTGIGQAQAQGILGATNALSGGIAGAGNSFSLSAIINALQANGANGGASSIYGNGSLLPSASFLNSSQFYTP